MDKKDKISITVMSLDDLVTLLMGETVSRNLNPLKSTTWPGGILPLSNKKTQAKGFALAGEETQVYCHDEQELPCFGGLLKKDEAEIVQYTSTTHLLTEWDVCGK